MQPVSHDVGGGGNMRQTFQYAANGEGFLGHLLVAGVLVATAADASLSSLKTTK